MDEQELAQENFKNKYVMGIKKPESFVYGPIENKHGIDNPVEDLNIKDLISGGNLVAGLLTINLSALTGPITYIAQNVSGTITLQSGSLTSTRVPFANSSGVLVDDADFTFVTDTLTVTKLSLGNPLGLSYGGTGTSLSDPGANKLLGWDDTDNLTSFIAIGTNLSYDHATHTLSSAGGSPSGSNTQLQYNNSSTFGGIPLDYLPTSGNLQLIMEVQTTLNFNGDNFFLQAAIGNGTGGGGDVDIAAGWDAGNVGFGGELFLAGSPISGKPVDTYLNATYPVDGDGGDVALIATGPHNTGTLPGVVKIKDPISAISARLNAAILATTDKTFTFPNQTGTFGVVVASTDLTGQTAAKTATTLFTPTITGMYRISIYLQVTTAASISSVLGGATGVVITFNDGDGNVAQTDTVGLTAPNGTIVTTLSTNTTATNLSGSLEIYAKSGVAIQFTIGYTSAGTAMAYAAHLRCEAI